jgi:hypothetical protein
VCCASRILISFTNDTFIFSRSNGDHLCNLHCLFLCFEAISSMRISQAKLELVPDGNVFNAKGVASILGCKVSSLPMKYHCLSLGASFKAKSIWDDVIER